MGKRNMWISSICLVRDVICHPVEIFKRMSNSENQREVLLVFFVAALIPFFKSFSARRQFINFFSDDRLNHLMSLLSIPQFEWIIKYFFYFLMLCGVFIICRMFGRTANIKSLILALMSISGVGIVSQILFLPCSFVPPNVVEVIGSYCVYLWILSLSVKAVQISQNLSFWKALVAFLFPAVIFSFIFGMTVVSPYIVWLIA